MSYLNCCKEETIAFGTSTSETWKDYVFTSWTRKPKNVYDEINENIIDGADLWDRDSPHAKTKSIHRGYCRVKEIDQYSKTRVPYGIRYDFTSTQGYASTT